MTRSIVIASRRCSRRLPGDPRVAWLFAASYPGFEVWPFFILSTRVSPPLAVVVPVLIMYWRFGAETRTSARSCSPLAHLLARGPAHEGIDRRDPARVRRGGPGRRILAPGHLRPVIVPQAATGMAATAASAGSRPWTEFVLRDDARTTHEAKTVPVDFAGLQGTLMARRGRRSRRATTIRWR